jgi:carbamate kinase
LYLSDPENGVKMKKLAVIALGGNALLRRDQEGTIDEQEQNTTETLENLVFLLNEGYDLVITHGNGPQIGNVLMRNEAGEQIYGIPRMPVDICVADTQGGIGYMVERMLRNVLNRHNIQKEVVTLVTMVEVDREDPAFSNPTKRIGHIYTREEAQALEVQKGWVFKEEVKKKGGWRRVVPSPRPVRISNEKVIETLARQGTIVIASGGGGIPVYIDEKKDVRPAEVVIDKDLASSLMASLRVPGLRERDRAMGGIPELPRYHAVPGRRSVCRGQHGTQDPGLSPVHRAGGKEERNN